MNFMSGMAARLAGAWFALLLVFASTSSAQAAALSVSVSSPAPGETFAVPASVALGAVAQGPVEWVDFYSDGVLIGWAEAEPYTFEWSGLGIGQYTVVAQATDASGQTVVSEPVSFDVIEASAISLSRGPYVMMGHYTNRSTLVWRTEPEADSWVEFGLSSAYGLAAGAVAAVQQHEVTLTNLLPGRTYHYRVRSAGQVLAAAEFRSAKAPGTPLRVAMTADHRSGAGGPIAAVIKSYKPDLILDAGDLMSWCDFGLLDADFFSVFDGPLSQSPFYWTPGNHEGSGCAPCLESFDLLPEDHQSYSIEYGDLQAIALNSDELPPPSWLREKLAASNKPWKFVFTHVPTYSASGGHGEWEGTYIRANYVPLMEEYKVTAYMAGHSHYYWRSQPIHGITHLVVGSGGAPLYDLGSLPSYTAGANDTAQVFAYADLDGDFMHVHAIDQFNTQVDETVIDRGCAFQLDGVLDASAPLVAQRQGGLGLWAAVAGRYLYLATTNARGRDHFILLSAARTDQMTNLGPIWAKSGAVMAYDAYLAGAGLSMTNGWFNSAGEPFGNLRVARSTTLISKTGVLEAVIDLEAFYGAVPPVIYLAAAAYDMYVPGDLDPALQCPPGNGDFDLQPDEFLAVNTAAITLGNGRLTSISFSPDGGALLEFVGDADATYEIEASADLSTWIPIGRQIADVRGRFTFRDYDAPLFAQQFYRTRRVPPR